MSSRVQMSQCLFAHDMVVVTGGSSYGWQPSITTYGSNFVLFIINLKIKGKNVFKNDSYMYITYAKYIAFYIDFYLT